MNLNNLTAITKSKNKRGGQGHGSGRGKTSGRGTKGQKARNKVPLRFDGNQLPFILRMPFRRGKGRNSVFKDKPIIINVKALNLLPKDSTVSVATLAKYNIVKKDDASKYGVKILGDGDISVPLTVQLPVSKGAAAKIEKAGGKIIQLPQ